MGIQYTLNDYGSHAAAFICMPGVTPSPHRFVSSRKAEVAVFCN